MATIKFEFDSFEESELAEFTESDLYTRIGSGADATVPDVFEGAGSRYAFLEHRGLKVVNAGDLGTNYQLDGGGRARRFLYGTYTEFGTSGGQTKLHTITTYVVPKYGDATVDIDVIVDVMWDFGDLVSSSAGLLANSDEGVTVEVTQTWTNGTKVLTWAYSSPNKLVDLWTETLAMYNSWFSGDRLNRWNHCVSKNASGTIVEDPTYSGTLFGAQHSGPYYEVIDADLQYVVCKGSRIRILKDEWWLRYEEVDAFLRYAAWTDTETLAYRYVAQAPHLDVNDLLVLNPGGLEMVTAGYGPGWETWQGSDSKNPSDSSDPVSDSGD